MSPATTNQKPSSQFGATLRIKLRQHNKDAHFHGLWECTIINEQGKVEKVISDADNLTICLENIQGELEALGH